MRRKTILSLCRRKLTLSRRYFCVVQWQKVTEQVHFHILLEATNIPKLEVYDIWSRQRPRSAGLVPHGSDPFGRVHVSQPRQSKGGNREAARRAACYVTKVPPQGFPSWVMEMGAGERIKRFSTNQGFWGRPAKPASPCRPPVAKPRVQRQKRTYREKAASCGTTSDVFEQVTGVDLETGAESMLDRYVATVGPADVHQPDPPRNVAGEVRAGSVE